MRATFAQAEQARAMVDLAVQQHHRANRRVAQAARRLQGGEVFELDADVGRGVAQDPLLAVVAHRDRRLRAPLRPQATVAHTGALTTVAVPLRKTTASGGAENTNVHGQLSPEKERPSQRWPQSH
ncbi:hypothetical protein D3C81_1729960 [compost metagenome]